MLRCGGKNFHHTANLDISTKTVQNEKKNLSKSKKGSSVSMSHTALASLLLVKCSAILDLKIGLLIFLGRGCGEPFKGGSEEAGSKHWGLNFDLKKVDLQDPLPLKKLKSWRPFTITIGPASLISHGIPSTVPWSNLQKGWLAISKLQPLSLFISLFWTFPNA